MALRPVALFDELADPIPALLAGSRQAAIEQTPHRGWDLRLALPLAGAPGTQEDAVSDPGVLAEVAA
jgi:hypothetical protein